MKSCIEYRCKACDIKFDSESKVNRHLKTAKHKKQQDVNAPHKCPYCNYKGYSSFLKYLHIRNKHKNLKYDKNISVKECKKKINLLLIKFRTNNIDPNKFFNYRYYAVNIKTLNKVQLNDFYKELKYVDENVNSMA